MDNISLSQLTISLDEFLNNSLFTPNPDRLTTTNINSSTQYFKTIRSQTDKTLLNILNAFNSYSFVRDEYLINFSNDLMLTNRRCFMPNNGYKLSIPLCNIVSFTIENNAGVIRYLKDGVEKTYHLTRWLNAAVINNVIETHKDDDDFKNDNIIRLISNGNSELNLDNYSEEIRPVKNYRGLITLCVIICLIGGCGYLVTQWNKSYVESGQAYGGTSPEIHYNKITGKKQKKCSWCGGYGKQGIAGESVEWCEKHPNGVNVICLRCEGTGYVDDDN